MERHAVKNRISFIILMIVFFILFTISSGIGKTDIKSVKKAVFAYLVDEYIHKCLSKHKLINSRSKNIRKAAALAALKGEYLKANKTKLIGEMLKAELLMKKYKVHHFLNARFFNYYASKSNLQQKVIEAKITKSYTH